MPLVTSVPRPRFNRTSAEITIFVVMFITGVALLLSVYHLSHQVTDLRTQVGNLRSQFSQDANATECHSYQQLGGNKIIQVCTQPSTPTTTG